MSKTFRFETANRAGRTGLRAFAAPLLAGSVLAMSASPALAGDRSVEKASEALAENEVDRAVDYAEKAVAEAPRDADRRALLGKAYLRAGRMASASAALSEAVALGDNSPRVALMLALANIGAGHPREGVAALASQGNAIPAADRGLAFALAGETARGAEIIASAIRAGADTPKTRQNLAYAFALDGRWREARMMAAQDVPADMLDKRITEWATTSRPDQVGVRVARLVGAEYQQDRGMPRELALANFPAPAPKPVAPSIVKPAPAMAEAKAPALVAPVQPASKPAPAPVKVAEKSEPKPVLVASLKPASAAVKTADVPASQAAKPTTMSMAVIQPTPAKAPATHSAPAQFTSTKPAPVKVAAVSAKPAPAPAKKAAPALPAPAASGSHVAQLGSYTSEANARAGWKVFQSRYSNLAGQSPVITRATVDGKDYYRVAAGGFDAKGASQMCQAVKASGHGCLPIAKASAKVPADNKVRVAKAD